MALCCLLPLVLLPILALTRWNIGNLLYIAVILICPLSMLFMMFSGRNCHSATREKAEQIDNNRVQ